MGTILYSLSVALTDDAPDVGALVVVEVVSLVVDGSDEVLDLVVAGRAAELVELPHALSAAALRETTHTLAIAGATRRK